MTRVLRSNSSLQPAIWGPRFDWTFERRYELAPATQTVLAQLADEGSVELTLYTATGDPRRRATSSIV